MVMEKRLDRIEKSIEGLLQGISELRESQKKLINKFWS
jgi:septation ring formation regulator EzrA